MKPTPAGAVFASATGLTGIFVVVWFPSLAGAVFCVLAAMLVLSWLSVRRRPDVAHRLPDTCFAGIRTTGVITVTNRSRLFPLIVQSLRVHYLEPGLRRPLRVRAAGPWPIPPGQSRTLSYPLRCLRRGRLRFEAITLEAIGTPPLISRTWETRDHAELTVYPRPALVRRPVPVRARGLERPVSTAMLTRPGAEDEFSGLREYAPGDSIRHIHWRTSFKIPGRLRVMEFAGAEAGQARIILDPCREGPPRRQWRLDFERAVSAAGALWDHLDRQGIFVTMQLPDRDFSGRPMIRSMLDALATLRPTPSATPVPPIEHGTAVFWVTANEEAPRRDDADLFVLNPSRINEYFQVL